MTSVPVDAAQSFALPRARRWSGATEFLLVGGLTPILFAVSWMLQRGLGRSAAELAVGFTMFHAAYVINDPHFSVTYLLFYRNARARAFGDAFTPVQRARYVFAGIVAPIALAAWGIRALVTRSDFSLGLMFQLMFFLVGWHYVKQGFGVMTVLAARRGVAFRGFERTAILAHVYAGWAHAWSTHGYPGGEVELKGVVYTTLARPHWLDRATWIVFVLSAIPVVVVLVRKWKREERLPLVTPLVALLVSIWTWSVYSDIDPLVRYAVPALHSIQYLYFVWLLQRGEGREREGAPWFETSARVRLGILAVSALALGWVLFHGAPWFLDDGFVRPRDRESPLGPTPCFAVLYAFVNLHHYFMDYVIWRRENPLTRYLRA